ncbi:MAG: DUF2177 family protein, partial [Alphaproteobacteria bacterium]
TTIIFLVLDAVMLTLFMKPLFTRHLGDLIRESPAMLAAALFYLGYTAGLIYLVSWPALKAQTSPILPAAVLGALAYGTYEFTSYAIMKGWSWQMVVADVTWGTVLTAFSAWAGVTIVRAIG